MLGWTRRVKRDRRIVLTVLLTTIINSDCSGRVHNFAGVKMDGKEAGDFIRNPRDPALLTPVVLVDSVAVRVWLLAFELYLFSTDWALIALELTLDTVVARVGPVTISLLTHHYSPTLRAGSSSFRVAQYPRGFWVRRSQWANMLALWLSLRVQKSFRLTHLHR